MKISGKQNTGVVVISSIPENASDWVFIMALLSYTLFPNRGEAQMLEHLIKRPKLARHRALKVVSMHALMGTAICLLAIHLLRMSSVGVALCSFAYLATVLLSNSRSLVIWFIRLYQLRAPAEVRLRCKLHPSCSEYMIAAVSKSGALSGVRQGLKRVRACGSPEVIELP